MIVNNESGLLPGGDVQGAGNGAANRIAFWTDANTISSSANLTETVNAAAGSSNLVTIQNTDNTNTASHAYFEAKVGGTAGGNPHIRFTITGGGTSAWLGVDNVNSDRICIGTGTTIAFGQSYLAITPSASAPLYYLGGICSSNANLLIGTGASNGTLEIGVQATAAAVSNIKLSATNNLIELRSAGTTRFATNSTGIGFFGTSPVAQTATYSVTNGTTDRALDVTGDTLAQGLAVLGTLITDLKAYGLLG